MHDIFTTGKLRELIESPTFDVYPVKSPSGRNVEKFYYWCILGKCYTESRKHIW